MLPSSPSRRCSTSTAAPLSLQSTRRPVRNFSSRLSTPQTAVKIPAGIPVDAIAPVALAANSPSTAATNPQLSLNEKLRKVLRELQVDALPESTPHKRPLVSLDCMYLDIFAESDADVGTTSLAFHEIDTPDTRPLRQPVRRLPYGEVREAVAKKI